jgi:hypothetical protein
VVREEDRARRNDDEERGDVRPRHSDGDVQVGSAEPLDPASLLDLTAGLPEEEVRRDRWCRISRGAP